MGRGGPWARRPSRALAGPVRAPERSRRRHGCRVPVAGEGAPSDGRPVAGRHTAAVGRRIGSAANDRRRLGGWGAWTAARGTRRRGGGLRRPAVAIRRGASARQAAQTALACRQRSTCQRETRRSSGVTRCRMSAGCALVNRRPWGNAGRLTAALRRCCRDVAGAFRCSAGQRLRPAVWRSPRGVHRARRRAERAVVTGALRCRERPRARLDPPPRHRPGSRNMTATTFLFARPHLPSGRSARTECPCRTA